MHLDELLDRPIAFHRPFVRITGSVTAALFLSQAIYWSRRTKDEDGWFYKTVADWEEETGLTFREQESARKELVRLGLLAVEKRGGTNRTNFFRVDFEAISASCNMRKTHRPTCGKRIMESAESAPCIHRLRTETTTEIPTEERVTRAKSKPSSLLEVLGRCKEIGLSHDEGEAFWHFYESKGWKVGKSPMVNWRSALSGWKSRAKSRGEQSQEDIIQEQLRAYRGGQ